MKPVSPDGEAFAKEFVRRLQKAVQRGEQRLAFCSHDATVQGAIRSDIGWQVFEVCARNGCKEIVGGPMPYVDVKTSGLVVIGDTSSSDGSCSVHGCSERVVEVHHWAPREIFGPACEQWSTDPLCLEHHREWHRRIGIRGQKTG